MSTFCGVSQVQDIPGSLHVQDNSDILRTAAAVVSTRVVVKILKKTPWHESASELYRPSDRRLSEKLVPAFTDRGCHVVSVTDP
jgi:hypothetical protein